MTDEQGTSGAILVVGGGISGLTAALEAAEVGNDVFLIDKNPSFGGRVAQLNEYFPKMCPPSCGLEINYKRIKNNRKIRTYTMASVSSVSGGPGNYEVSVEVAPRYVNSNCTACGDCAAACPDEIDNEFNFGMDKCKAAYLPHEMAFPRRYVIAKDALSAEGAEAVKASCKYDAVDLDMKSETMTLNVSSIIWATGWQPYAPENMDALNFTKSDAIITNMMLERMAAPNGPTGGSLSDLKQTNTMIVGTDQMAVDAFGATLLEKTLNDLPFIGMAEAAGLGTADYRSLNPVMATS